MRQGQWSVLVLAWLLGCSSAAAPVRRAAERGDVLGALRAYRGLVEERGEGDPDLLADVATATLRAACESDEEATRAAGFMALRGLGVRAFDLLDVLARRPGPVGDRAVATKYEMQRRDGNPPARLREAAASNDRERRIAGIASLRGRRGREVLTQWIATDDPQLRQAAVIELGRAHHNEAAFAVLARVARTDANKGLRALATSSLSGQGDRASDTLAALFEENDPIVRMSVPSSWMAVDAERASVQLRAVVARGEINSFSIECARALSVTRDGEAAEFLLRAMREGRREQRAQASVASYTLGSQIAGRLADELSNTEPEVVLRVAGVLIRQDAHREAATRALRQLSTSLDGFVSVRALSLLASRDDRSVIEPLRRALQSPDASVRRMAVMAWPDALGSGSDCDPLAPLLQDPDRSVALLAAVEIILIAAR